MWPWSRKETDYHRLQLAYEARLGRMTLAWNQMEGALDGLVEALFWLHDLTALKISQRPMSLERKLDVVRVAHKGLAALAPHKAAGLRLADNISDIMDLRHRLTHGVLAQCLANGDVMLMNFRFRPDGPTLEMPIMQAQKINALTNKAVALFPRIVAHVDAIAPSLEEMRRRWPQIAEEAARQFDSAVRRLPASDWQGVTLGSDTPRR